MITHFLILTLILVVFPVFAPGVMAAEGVAEIKIETKYAIVPKGGMMQFNNGRWETVGSVNYTGELQLNLLLDEKSYQATCSIIDHRIQRGVTHYKCNNGEWFHLGSGKYSNDAFPSINKSHIRTISEDRARENIQLEQNLNDSIWQLWKIYLGKNHPDQVFVGYPDSKNVNVDSKIHRVQTILDQLGYDPGVADGVWGKKTSDAVKKYQEDNDLPGTGELDISTKKALGLE